MPDTHVQQKYLSTISRIFEFSTVRFLFLLIVGMAILAARRPEGLLRPQFYAEDGAVFFRDAYELPFYQSFFVPYAGYYHFLPRLFAEIATLFPIKYAPLLYNTISLLVASVCLTWTYLPHFRRLINKDWVRLMLVFFFLLLSNQESIMKLSYLQWYVLLWITLCCFMELPKRSLSCFFLILVILLAFWTVANGFIFIPIFIFNIFRPEDNRDRLQNLFFLFAAVSACIGNLLPYLSATGEILFSGIHTLTLIHGLFNAVTYKVICSALFGSEITYWLFFHGWCFIYAFSFAFLVLIFLIGLKVRKQLSSSVLILVYIIISSVVCFVLRPSVLITFVSGEGVAVHDRYFFLASYVFCLLVFIIGSEFQRGFPASAIKKIILSALIILLLALQLTSFCLPKWTPCDLHWNKYAELIRVKEDEATARRKPQTILIPINPIPWKIELRITPRSTDSVIRNKSMNQKS